jgi:hypothetical protein
LDEPLTIVRGVQAYTRVSEDAVKLPVAVLLGLAYE